MKNSLTPILLFICLAFCAVQSSPAQVIFGPPTGLIVVDNLSSGYNLGPALLSVESIALNPPDLILSFDPFAGTVTDTSAGNIIFDPGNQFGGYGITTVPEPTTIALAALGAIILAVRPRRAR